MKYNNFIEYIQTVLQNPEYEYKLKFYDIKGNTTLKLNDIKYIFVINNTILFELPDNKSNILNIWKNATNNNVHLDNIIKNIRKQANLNGILVKLNIFNAMDRESINHIIKKNIKVYGKDKDNKTMNESKIAQTYYSILNSVKTARKTSDAFITEGLKVSRTISLLNEVNKEIASLNSFKNSNISDFNNGIILCKTLNEMEDYVLKYEDKELVKTIYENINLFKNVGKFVKNRYELGVLNPIINENTYKFYSNIKLYKNQITEIDNMASAYIELKNNINEASCQTDLIRVIKNSKICETYNVKRKDLINYWLAQSVSETPITSKTYIEFIAENLDGKQIKLPDVPLLGIRLIAEHLNNNGSINDKCIENVVKECKVNRELKNFIDVHKEKSEYTNIAKNLFIESSDLLRQHMKDFNKDYRERKGSEKYIKIMEAKLKTNDPALYYISEELQEYENIDVSILEEGLKPFARKNDLHNIVLDIIDNKISIGNQLNESLDTRNTLEKIYNKLNEELTNKTNLAVASSVFYLIHKPIALSESQKKYINCLIKYSK